MRITGKTEDHVMTTEFPSLPDRPDIGQLRRQAKDLLREAVAGDSAAIKRLSGNPNPKLSDAQFAIARELDFASWPKLTRAIAATTAASGTGEIRKPSATNQHLAESTFKASTFLDAAKENGWEPGRLPSAIVFVFQNSFASQLEHDDRFVEDKSLAVSNGRFFITKNDPAIAVSCMSAGGAFVGQVENQRALDGAERFVIFNLAGGFGQDISVGDIAVIETAVRDDGISPHYLPPGDTVDADHDLTELLLTATQSVQPHARTHISWTNPATFRQTEAAVNHYIEQGVTIVESEIASLFAVCQALDVRAGAVVVTTGISPEPSDDVPAADWATLRDTQLAAFDAVIDKLQNATA